MEKVRLFKWTRLGKGSRVDLERLREIQETPGSEYRIIDDWLYVDLKTWMRSERILGILKKTRWANIVLEPDLPMVHKITISPYGGNRVGVKLDGRRVLLYYPIENKVEVTSGYFEFMPSDSLVTFREEVKSLWTEEIPGLD